MTYDVAIIGGGVGGLSAAMYCGRFGLKTVVIAEKRGGTVMIIGDIHNYPGFKEINGMELAQKIEEHAKEYEVEFIDRRVDSLEKKGDEFIITMGEDTIKSKTVIFATGGDWKKLGVPGEKEYLGKGVHYCAVCDGALYKGKTLGIVGGANAAAKEAMILAEYADKVYMIYRQDEIRAEHHYKQLVEKNPKIEIITNAKVTEIKGEKFVNRVILDKEHEGSKELAMDGIFIAIGHVSVSELAGEAGVKLNKEGEVITDIEMQTNIPGFFAAGDVTNQKYKQAIVAVGEAVIAAHSAYYFLKQKS
ncbi:MAG: FAD-dependent oxidoreductase [Nanoarchaeota archaeon]|nr:FAD-dependent oxidoreductase [Nanoarchaeota archaeon]